VVGHETCSIHSLRHHSRPTHDVDAVLTLRLASEAPTPAHCKPQQELLAVLVSISTRTRGQARSIECDVAFFSLLTHVTSSSFTRRISHGILRVNNFVHCHRNSNSCTWPHLQYILHSVTIQASRDFYHLTPGQFISATMLSAAVDLGAGFAITIWATVIIFSFWIFVPHFGRLPVSRVSFKADEV
jgi:hypothetical protein